MTTAQKCITFVTAFGYSDCVTLKIKNRFMATRNAKRNGANDAQRHENTSAATQQVENRKKNGKQTPAPAPGTPVPAKLEELEARLGEKNTALNEVKKQSQKLSEKLAKAREDVANQRYCVAVSRQGLGTATEDDLAIIASRKAEDNTAMGLAKFFAKEFKDSDEVATARKEAREEEGSLASAIAETIRNWSKCYSTLYGSIGITAKKQLTPALLKGLCPFLQVATADGLKAATVTRTAVRKNGKAVKKDGKRVYKYTLRERSRWSAYGLFETLERNTRMAELFSEDELKVRIDLLNAQVSAFRALKKAQEDAKSDVPEVAAKAADRKKELADAAKAAAKAVKENTNTTTQHTTKGGELKKVS